MDSCAHRDDLEITVAQLGEGVQKKGDRLACDTHGPAAFVVVVGRQSAPTVHIAVRRTGRRADHLLRHLPLPRPCHHNEP